MVEEDWLSVRVAGIAAIADRLHLAVEWSLIGLALAVFPEDLGATDVTSGACVALGSQLLAVTAEDAGVFNSVGVLNAVCDRLGVTQALPALKVVGVDEIIFEGLAGLAGTEVEGVGCS